MSVLPTIERLAVFVLALCCLVLMLWLTGKGIDLTDTSYYISWAAYPAEHRYSLTWFGSVTSALYQFAGGNIRLMSAYAIIALFLSGAWLAWTIMMLTTSRKPSLLMALVFGCGFFSFYSLWILVPGYNWLALVSVMLTVSGLLDFLRQVQLPEPSHHYRSSLLIGLGLWLAVFAKFTTALALGVIGLAFLLLVRPPLKRIIVVGIQAVFWMIILSAIVHFGIRPIDQLISDTIVLNKAYADLGSEITLSKTLAANLVAIGKIFQLKILLLAGILGLITPFLISAISHPKFLVKIPQRYVAVAILAVVLIAIYRNESWNLARDTDAFGRFLGVITFSWSAWVSWRFRGNQEDGALRIFGIALLMLAGAYAMQFGSQNDLRSIFNLCFGLFFLIAALPWMPIISAQPSRAYPCALVCLALLLKSLTIWAATPYRLNAAAWEQTHNVNAPLLAGARFDRDTANALNNFRETALNAGLSKDDVLIDMSGASPYAHLLFGTPPLAAPWLIGGPEKRREVFVNLVLRETTTIQRKCAWILHSDSPRAFNVVQMAKLGLRLDERQQVAVFDRHHEGLQQQLYKPGNCD